MFRAKSGNKCQNWSEAKTNPVRSQHRTYETLFGGVEPTHSGDSVKLHCSTAPRTDSSSQHEPTTSEPLKIKLGSSVNRSVPGFKQVVEAEIHLNIIKKKKLKIKFITRCT